MPQGSSSRHNYNLLLRKEIIVERTIQNNQVEFVEMHPERILDKFASLSMSTLQAIRSVTRSEQFYKQCPIRSMKWIREPGLVFRTTGNPIGAIIKQWNRRGNIVAEMRNYLMRLVATTTTSRSAASSIIFLTAQDQGLKLKEYSKKGSKAHYSWALWTDCLGIQILSKTRKSMQSSSYFTLQSCKNEKIYY